MTDRPSEPAAGAAAEPLRGRTVVVGVCGGIAAYKAAELVRALVKAGATVRAAMTPSAQQFIGPMTLQALTGQPVATDLFDLGQESDIGHIRAADGADLVIVAPATANAIARMAAGMANDIVTAIVLATRAPVLLAPAMNVNMWQHPATQHNVATLVARGAYTVGPDAGFLACRWTGPGRMAEPADIVEAARRALSPQDLAGRRIAISAGPTYEPIDPVRFVGNRSSGRMGFALALAALRRGADVTLVTGPVALEPPIGATVVRVATAREMKAAIDRAARDADAVIMAAAVADFRAKSPARHKLKRSEQAAPAIALAPNPDILAGLGRARGRRRRPVLVGFAAETRDVVAYAERKLAAKRCDLVVANDVSQPDAGFDVDTNRVVIVSRDAPAEAVPLATKLEIAHRILDRVRERW